MPRRSDKEQRARDRFARAFARALKKAHDGQPVTYDANDFCVRIGDEAAHFLDNRYDLYRGAPWYRRKAVLRDFVRGAATLASDGDEQVDWRTVVLPCVRDAAWLHGMADRGLPASEFRPIGHHHIVTVIEDYAHRITFPPKGAWAELGTDFEEALGVAHSRLWEMSNEDFLRRPSGLWCSPWRDCHDTARLALPGLADRLDVRGEPIALIPHRDYLLVTGSQDIDALRDMFEGGRQLWEGPYSLSLWPLVWRNDAWTDWVPPDGHPIANEAALARALHMARSYGAQKQAIDKRHENDRVDVFVATFQASQHTGTQAVETWCGWTSGVPTLLPQTDVVAIKSDVTDESIWVSWEAFCAVVGARLGTTDMYPPRWMISTTMSESDLRHLRAADMPR